MLLNEIPLKTTNSMCEGHAVFMGLDDKPLKTPEDFKRHEVYCTAKVAMHQAIVDGLTPSYERLCRELREMKRR